MRLKSLGGGDNKELLIKVQGDDSLKISDLYTELASLLPPALEVKITFADPLTLPFCKRRIAVR